MKRQVWLFKRSVGYDIKQKPLICEKKGWGALKAESAKE
ncbi:hypothetical protein X474_19040 [Dethiosulfatarculus sandiegensis]|uniref:Uncharacterized protein n=1 Tax=Dethiosulfatarculus sandiegensis TaxID=1429043 RepID=A0A0D2JSG0_9BACT|nr:hypothetical protein X474_19040 [Dethiosulfatarculus sandiegensis]